MREEEGQKMGERLSVVAAVMLVVENAAAEDLMLHTCCRQGAVK